ncbi:MAG: hypothetical protein IJP82_01015 [Bacteroidaceae bacterium]|nr:hypothetical protein [Bacteroidaceae bacterium]
MTYTFKSEKELEILIPEKHHSIIMHGNLSVDGKTFVVSSDAIDNLKDLYSKTFRQEIKRGISKQSIVDGNICIVFE